MRGREKKETEERGERLSKGICHQHLKESLQGESKTKPKCDSGSYQGIFGVFSCCWLLFPIFFHSPVAVLAFPQRCNPDLKWVFFLRNSYERCRITALPVENPGNQLQNLPGLQKEFLSGIWREQWEWRGAQAAFQSSVTHSVWDHSDSPATERSER